MAGKKVILTGAGRGLGKQMALHLARAGADIACVARTSTQIEETAAEVRALGRQALAIPTDVAKSAQIDAMVAQVLDAWGQVDVFIANAGGGGRSSLKDVADISDDDWYDSIDINLSSTFFSARAIVPHFRQRGGGVIITLGSGSGLRGDSKLLGYGSAKGGIVGLTMILATQLVKDNIRVNCIVPGFVMQSPPKTPAEIENTKARGRFIPAGRVGQADELGPLALFLASDASSYITGECFYIDGGGLAGGLAPSGWDVRAGRVAAGGAL
jgi:NAD(P)-dependent dehydrogenase (short-subunit alcohol dehydrogenase family)